jgi:probable rRNA maturation factor
MTATPPAAVATMPPADKEQGGYGEGASLAIDLSIEAGDWPPERVLSRLAAAAFEAAVAELELPVADGAEISIVFTDDVHIRALNREWRQKDKATNVLSFPAMPVRPGVALPPVLGDIVLAAETIRREAGLEDKPFEHHLIHLMVHGFLHIVGYDHETDAEAEEMEEAERRILARLAIPDPYG